MKAEILKISGNWLDVKAAAMATIGKLAGSKPSSKWKEKMLLAEHSPIREIVIKFRWIDIPYWVAMHFRTHHIGVQWYISTQRDDRQKEVLIPRGEKPQNAPVIMQGSINLQEVINISKKRLCNTTATETKMAWQMFLNELAKYEKEVVSVCVPECVYRGKCFEFISCGFDQSQCFKESRANYEDLLG